VFSSTLSNTTTVSYSENPRIVRKPITVDGVTSKPISEYTPAVTTMSCSRAMIAPIAIFGWNRSARNATTATRNTARAISAWSVMSLPHAALTASSLTCCSWTPAASATACFTAVVSSLVSWPVRTRIVSLPTTWALDTAAPAFSAAARTSLSCWLWPGTLKELPPSNSMPKLNPRKTIEAMQSRTTTAVTL
jgi:hypothetical protein